MAKEEQEKALEKLKAALQKAAPIIEGIISNTEYQYEEAAKFYKDWAGRTPPRFKRFLDWLFREKYGDLTLAEFTALPPEVKEEDIEQAGQWLLAKIQEAKQEEEARRERLELAQQLAKEVLKEYPETEIFGDEQSVHWVHFPILEEAFGDFTRLKKDAYSEEAFREKLRAKLAALKADIEETYNRWNPEEAQPFRGTIGGIKDFHKERQPERMDYLMARFRNNLLIKFLTALFPEAGELVAGQAQPQKEELTFESLFIFPSVPALVIRAMQEAEPEPLLNEDGEGILFGKTTVAPVVALVDILFGRKLIKDGVAKKEAYMAICSRFDFESSPRPDKARKEGAGTYQDYKESFHGFFLEERNRPK